MIGKRISIKYIIEKLYRDLGVNQELNVDDVIEWSAEALMYIGAFTQFEEKTTMLNVENCKVALPCDLYKLKQVSYNNQILSWSGNSLPTNHFCSECELPPCCSDITFYINDCYLFVNWFDSTQTTGDICLSYIAVPTDEEGLPTVPDDVSYMKALTAYVTKMLDYQDWRKGKIPDKIFQHSEKEWNYYCGQTKAQGNMPDLTRMEELKNVWVRLLPQQNEFLQGFRNLGKAERKKLH